MRWMRIAVPLLAVGIGLAFALSVAMSGSRDRATDSISSSKTEQTQPSSTPTETAQVEPSPEQDSTAASETDNESVVESSAGSEPSEKTADETNQPKANLGKLTAQPAEQRTRHTIGSLEPDSGFKLQIDTTSTGAAIYNIWLADYYDSVKREKHYIVAQEERELYPYAASSVTINGERVFLYNLAWDTGGVTSSGDVQSIDYTATIIDEKEQPVARVVRTYALTKDSYDLKLNQRIVNLTSEPIEVVWQQNLQGDVTQDGSAYMGDRRQLVTGYFDDENDDKRTRIWTDGAFLGRHDIVKKESIWPNDASPEKAELAWVAAENRYFAIVTHPVVGQPPTQAADLTALSETFDNFVVQLVPTKRTDPELSYDKRTLMLNAATKPLRVEPDGQVQIDLAIYAGPRKKEVFASHPYTILNFDDLIRYELGCWFCTFQVLARGLLGFMRMMHDYVFNDWGLAIITLVLVVRLLLHPITKKAQVNMMKLGKQMQALKPDMDKIKKKYADDQAKQQQEMTKLYREKGINPANMLGCLPMFLQMPIWVALYAMLYFAIELRHEPAFYSIFQHIGDLVGMNWQFLADLSRSDRFIVFFDDGADHVIDLYLIQFDYSALNILPFLWAITMFFQQKLTTPPPADEQAAQQQKIMRIMLFLFPIMLYAAPSGLTLYILASTAAGILDSWMVRRHVQKQEEAGTLFQKKERKPGGLVDRLSKAFEESQKRMSEMEKQKGKQGGYKQRKKK